MRIDSTTYLNRIGYEFAEELKAERINLLKSSASKNMVEDMFEVYSDSINALYNVWEPVKSLKEMEKRLNIFIQQWDEGIRWRWLIYLKSAKKVIGDIVLVKLDERWGEAEIGFNLNRKYQKQGFAKEATKTLINHLLTFEKINRISAYTCELNSAANHLLRSLRFEQVGKIEQSFQVEDKLFPTLLFHFSKG